MDFQFGESTCCRACGSSRLKRVLALNSMPPGDKYASSPNDVPTINLSSSIDMCEDCQHIQMSGWADPAYIYANYLSRPATINSNLKTQYDSYATQVARLAGDGSVLEIGSNDGLFLALLTEQGIQCAGIEPAANMVKFANERGVKTVHAFVSPESVADAVDLIGRPNVILANHSFSNVLDIQSWASSLIPSLKDDGYLVLQTFYQKSVLDSNLIENYNHEHLTYSFISPLANFFGKYGLKLANAQYIDAKGGSIRLVMQKTVKTIDLDSNTKDLLLAEKTYLDDPLSAFSNSSNYITNITNELTTFFADQASHVTSIAAYGTSIGATVFNYQFGLTKLISEFYDDDTLRQGTFAPGTARPVSQGRSNDMNKYSYCIVLAPLYADKIISNNTQYLENGGTFLKVRPDFSIVSSV